MTARTPDHPSYEEDRARPATPRDIDSLLATAVAAGGVALVASALRRDPRALIMYAGLEGSVALVLVAAALAMLGGLRARSMLAILAPIVALQVVYLSFRGIGWQAAAGVELAGMGAIGFVATKLRPLLGPRPGS